MTHSIPTKMQKERESTKFTGRKLGTHDHGKKVRSKGCANVSSGDQVARTWRHQASSLEVGQPRDLHTAEISQGILELPAIQIA
jgi:hypothetical protein